MKKLSLEELNRISVSEFKEIQKSKFSEFTPNGDAIDVDLKHTDSGRIKVVLLSSKMLDYTSINFPFTEFPKGVDVTLYDNKGKKICMQSDGNLVIYNRAMPKWSSQTHGNNNAVLCMQNDGNLVIYNSNNEVKWSSGTFGNTGAYAKLEDNGRFNIYNSQGKLIRKIY